MKIESATVREIRMPLVTPFETSFGRTSLRRILLVCLRIDGMEGWGEVTCGEGPYYNAETTDTAALILRDFALPRVVGRSFARAADIATALAPIRGHAMTKAAIENAAWDVEARQAGQPLWRHIGGRQREFACGVSIGIKESTGELLDVVERELAAGYQRIKIKIKPGCDVGPLEAIRARWPEVPLMADANSAYTLDDAAHLRAFDRFQLMMLEQPLWHDDIHRHARLQRDMATPICLDEPIHHARDAELAIALQACRVINVKLGRVGGFSSALAVHEVTRAANLPVWCGGMLESGIGRAHNIALSTLENFRLPGDVSASRRYWQQDIVEPEVTVTPRGTICAPETSGLGFAIAHDRIEKLTVWKHEA